MDTGWMTLDEVRADVFRRLSHGVADRRSSFRNPALGTAGLDGTPEIRTVVLRAFDPVTRVLTLHSDVRSHKIKELQANPAAILHVWDDDAQVQVRLRGRATVAAGDEAAAAWAKLHAGSRGTYAVRPTPGAVLDDPAVADVDRLDEAAAFRNLRVIRTQLLRLDWLHLAQGGQRRAVFAWTNDKLEQHWVVP